MLSFINLVLFLVLTFTSFGLTRKGFGPGDQDWGYIEVRPHCRMFWWLHYTTATKNYTQRPLLIWIQGGPGGSGSGEGNIQMSGLVDEDLRGRDYSYVHKANVLYIDNPVGTGYSYVDEDKGGKFVTTTEEATNDFVSVLKEFYHLHPEFVSVPVYLLGESYGGKWAAAFGQAFHDEIVRGNLIGIFKGIGLAYPCNKFILNVESTADYLYQTGVVDRNGLTQINSKLKVIKKAYDGENWGKCKNLIDGLTNQILNNYKISYTGITDNPKNLENFNFNTFMDKTISPLLNISVPFGNQTSKVETAIVDLILPTLKPIEYMLNNTDVKIVIYNGQLDWVVNYYGTYSWVVNLNWKYSMEWDAARHRAFYVNGVHEGFKKSYGQLMFFSVKRAGHKVNVAQI